MVNKEKFDEKSRVSSSLEKSDILAEELGTSKSTTYLDKESSVTLESVGSVGNTSLEMLKNPEDLLKLLNRHSQEIYRLQGMPLFSDFYFIHFLVSKILQWHFD